MKALQKNRSVFSKAVIVCSPLFLYLLLVSFAEAAGGYIPIVGIPGLTNQNTASLPDYLNKIYFFTITIGALYGVVKIAFAGVKYSMSDIITNKESAKEDIKGVLLGLAILLIPFIVLREINPNLIRLDVLSSVKTKINLISGAATPGATTKTAEQVCKETKNKIWSGGVCCTAGTNTDQCLALNKYEAKPANKTTSNQLQYISVSENFCSGKKIETGDPWVFRKTSNGISGSAIGECTSMPLP